MNSGEEQIDVALYIDELKSDDPLLKINAVSKLPVIASALSTSRIERELIPYLAFIITEQDNEDEFLLKLSENLFALLQATPSISKTTALKVFEPLAVLEDPAIRQSAVRALAGISRDSPAEALQCLYRLSNYSVCSKVSAMELASGILRENSASVAQIKELEKMALVLFSDNSLAVRRAAVRTFAEFWAAALNFGGKADFPTDLKIAGQAFLAEFIKGYSPSAAEAILFEMLEPRLCGILAALSDRANLARLAEAVLSLLGSRELSWRVKYMAVSAHELWGLVPERLGKLSELLKALFKEEEQEVKSAVVRAFAFFFGHFDSAKIAEDFWEDIREFVKSEVAVEKNGYVREALIALTRKMLMNKARSSLLSSAALELFDAAFQDLGQDARLKSLDFIESFFQSDKLQGVEGMLERIGEMAADKNWRLRLTLLEKLEKITEALLKQPAKSALLKKIFAVNFKFKDDLVFAVRAKMLENIFLQLKEKNPPSSDLLENFKEVVFYWTASRNYIFRVSGLQALGKLAGLVSQGELSALVARVFQGLEKEEVPNVKINMLKTLEAVKGGVKEADWREIADKLRTNWEKETDKDVKALLERIFVASEN